ncbi:FG-GAP repeat protein, partial [bacterium]|nr:FG-GAP repeat protein [bacterium]
FTLTDGGWVQVGANIDGENEYDNSGYSVAMNAGGDTVIIGAPYNDVNGDASGHARVFRSAPEPTPTPEAGSAAAVPYPGPFTQTPAPAGTAPNPVAVSPETPTAEPAAAAAAGDGVAGLAHTGTTTTTLAYLAVGLIGFGALLAPVSRRRN